MGNYHQVKPTINDSKYINIEKYKLESNFSTKVFFIHKPQGLNPAYLQISIYLFIKGQHVTGYMGPIIQWQAWEELYIGHMYSR